MAVAWRSEPRPALLGRLVPLGGARPPFPPGHGAWGSGGAAPPAAGVRGAQRTKAHAPGALARHLAHHAGACPHATSGPRSRRGRGAGARLRSAADARREPFLEGLAQAAFASLMRGTSDRDPAERVFNHLTPVLSCEVRRRGRPGHGSTLPQKFYRDRCDRRDGGVPGGSRPSQRRVLVRSFLSRAPHHVGRQRLEHRDAHVERRRARSAISRPRPVHREDRRRPYAWRIRRACLGPRRQRSGGPGTPVGARARRDCHRTARARLAARAARRHQLVALRGDADLRRRAVCARGGHRAGDEPARTARADVRQVRPHGGRIRRNALRRAHDARDGADISRRLSPGCPSRSPHWRFACRTTSRSSGVIPGSCTCWTPAGSGSPPPRSRGTRWERR